MSFCPECCRKLTNVMVNGNGSCRAHGIVNADYTDLLMVVDTETDDVVGRYVGTDEDTGDIAAEAFDGTTRYLPRLYCEVLRSSEIQDGEW